MITKEINQLKKDIKKVIKTINKHLVNEGIDQNYILDIAEYIKTLLANIYGDKLLYPEILNQFIYEKIKFTPIDNEFSFNFSIELNKKILKQLKEINKHSPEQKSDEWYAYRYERITASDIASVFNKSPFNSRNKLLQDKCKDFKDTTFSSNKYMDHGNKYEDCAAHYYEYLSNSKDYEFGCLPHHNISFLGASPDGITENGIMLEIKCPLSRPIKGIPPIYYWYQIQIQLEVADLPRCDYIECKFIEKEKDDFFELIKTHNITECKEIGFIIQIIDKTKNKYIYKYNTFGSKVSDFKEWENNTINEILKSNQFEYVKTIYWVLEEYGLCKIYRDKRWYRENINSLSNFWDEVLEGRKKIRENKDFQIPTDNSKINYPKKQQKYLMYDSDDSQTVN